MKTVIKTTLIFAIALLSVTVVKAQKVDKKQARYLAYRKMIDTADFTIILEKAYPPAMISAGNANTIDISAGSPSITITHGVMTCDIPYFLSSYVGSQTRIKFSTSNFIYQASKTGKPDDYQYNVIAMPKPGVNEMGNDIKSFVFTILNEDTVSLQIIFNDNHNAGYEGYIQKAKKN
jgi:hypothetical protein